MTVEDIQNICNKLPHVTEDIKWENNLCFLVGGKIFLMVGLDHVPSNASFKVDEEEFQALTDRDGFVQAPYMAKNKWVLIEDINKMKPKEWEYYIKKSYEIIKSKLSMKKLKEMEENRI